MLFQSIRSRLGLSAAIVIQALVFAYIHIEVVGSPPAIVGLVALGLWFAAIFHRVGSLVVAISAHAFYNLAVVAIQVIFVTSE
jgi:membrane protease YdiL (CAAX protease family)